MSRIEFRRVGGVHVALQHVICWEQAPGEMTDVYLTHGRAFRVPLGPEEVHAALTAPRMDPEAERLSDRAFGQRPDDGEPNGDLGVDIAPGPRVDQMLGLLARGHARLMTMLERQSLADAAPGSIILDIDDWVVVIDPANLDIQAHRDSQSLSWCEASHQWREI